MAQQSDAPEETLWEGRFLAAKRRGKWEYAARARNITAAVILAVVEGKVLLVSQHRVALGCDCLELPAGLIGDEGDADEAVEIAAARELEEETGYRPERIEALGVFASSPGMVSETFTFVRASGLERVGQGGGLPGEGITVHTVPLAEVPAFVRRWREGGGMVDVKLLALLGARYLAGEPA